MERLTPQDLSMLWPDDVGWPQDIGALTILGAGRLLDADGRFDAEAVREAIQARLHLVPRFRQRLFLPRRGLGWPLWVDAEDFDIADHVHVVPVAAPAGRPSCCSALSGGGGARWIGPGRCGRCGSCPGCPTDGWAST